MRLLDTNGVDALLSVGQSPKEKYYLAPDIVDEVELARIIHKRNLPQNIFPIEGVRGFKISKYLKRYRQMLNKFGGRSFFNMTGFGDISILASLHVARESFPELAQMQLFGGADALSIYSGDEGLVKKVRSEFGEDVRIFSINEIV